MEKKTFVITEASVVREHYEVEAASYEEALRLHNEGKSTHDKMGECLGLSNEYSMSFEQLPESVSDEGIEYIRQEHNANKNAEYIEGIVWIEPKE
ncbi:hypothetical protein AAXE64_28050 [Priestia megaterium]